MWLMLNDAFLSIVSKDCPRSSLLVRARRKGDIEKIFPDATVKRSTTTDYLFRAVVPRDQVEQAIVGEVRRINYGNFKDSVTDKPLHDAYLRCWTAMASLQPTKPYSGLPPRGSGKGGIHDAPDLSDIPEAGEDWFAKAKVVQPKKRGKRRSMKRGR